MNTWKNTSSIQNTLILTIHNTTNRLKGFIDHKGNMFLLNDNYDRRKNVFQIMLQRYNTLDFDWCNQSFTQLASSIFKLQNGFLPQSSYNPRIQKILHDFHPKALRYCNPQIKIDDSNINFVCIDIPIYNIHSNLQKFQNKNYQLFNFKQAAEYYIEKCEISIKKNTSGKWLVF